MAALFPVLVPEVNFHSLSYYAELHIFAMFRFVAFTFVANHHSSLPAPCSI